MKAGKLLLALLLCLTIIPVDCFKYDVSVKSPLPSTSAEEETFAFSTYFDQPNHDPTGLAVNSTGHIFTSLTGGAFVKSRVIVFSPDGSSVVGAYEVGGSFGAEVEDIAVDDTGFYVVGTTWSNDFYTVGAYDTTLGGNIDGFAAKYDNAGNLLYATYLGGSGDVDNPTAVVVSSGLASVCGYTASSDFPTTGSAYDTTHNGGADAFVLKLNIDGSSLAYSTFLGGTADDGAFDVDIRNNYPYVIGSTKSKDGSFPTTTGVYQTTHHDADVASGYEDYEIDMFVTKLGTDGSALSYSTFIGSENVSMQMPLGYWQPLPVADWGDRINVLPDGSVCLSGHLDYTSVYGIGFPASNLASDNSFITTKDAGSYGFMMGTSVIIRLSATGSTIVYSTLHNGVIYGIDVDVFGSPVVVATTIMPTTSNAYVEFVEEGANTGNGVIVTRYSPDMSDIVYSSYMILRDDASNEVASDLVVNSTGHIIFVGSTTFTDYPTTNGSYMEDCPGGFFPQARFLTALNPAVDCALSSPADKLIEAESSSGSEFAVKWRVLLSNDSFLTYLVYVDGVKQVMDVWKRRDGYPYGGAERTYSQNWKDIGGYIFPVMGAGIGVHNVTLMVRRAGGEYVLDEVEVEIVYTFVKSYAVFIAVVIVVSGGISLGVYLRYYSRGGAGRQDVGVPSEREETGKKRKREVSEEPGEEAGGIFG